MVYRRRMGKEEEAGYKVKGPDLTRSRGFLLADAPSAASASTRNRKPDLPEFLS
jgi:hypothetical protein